ncbi:imidazole glycerol phosphate synthase subunit HisH [Azospirillum brasilense]|uniref:Imidazole glycerol phosphate synthase subunit HisH n=1 Tax=Azospirillum brasilense TaxID=192 RepID=A0A0P0EUD8_AZOBR|nr:MULTISPECIES: imidazole glycerol phosphate synthase subunit HisH [Azospirillum]ALJ34016.1 imidazole glycerol phosphate synthase subunit HisH [Azospirillum brasilense]MDW7553019.1 imidazole glycerol phosphate synthase subunit HisH [Azospirillum brasilense]MDW7591789.1 imidazole glycerol phosphate synthase subunit HisH [Azospirillum brasilense]MDW7627934.1 imidazole glycerol phosphate synthase subunit HisH [Azospirillum brasilense]MDX5952597.1 imidazole glycerol phosphate synthase subunit His
METVALIDYGSGNLRSAAKALERAAAGCHASFQVLVTSDADAVRKADRVVLPGVGAFADCKRGLSEVPGMLDALEEVVHGKGRPFLGICVGMQLMAERGREYGVTEGLGWIKGEVVKLEPADPTLKIPHMGWNELDIRREHPVLAGLPERAHAYFVHSYRFAVERPEDVIASADYGGPFAAVVGRDNLVGTQFHPEKSQETGLALVANFLTWRV